MATFLAVLLMVYTFRNLLGLLVCNHFTDFSARNKYLTAKLLQQETSKNICFKFYRRHYELISKFNVGLKTLIREGLLEPEFYD